MLRDCQFGQLLPQLEDLAVCIKSGVSLNSWNDAINQQGGSEKQKVPLHALPVLRMNAAGAPLLRS